MAEKEIIKTAKEFKPEIKNLGIWLSDLFGPVSEISGIISEELKLFRIKRQFELKEKFEIYLKLKGYKNIPQKVPLTFGIQLLENASLEDDDSLHDMWAKLLANAADPKSNIEPKRSYIDILKQIDKKDAFLLKNIYIEHKKNPNTPIYTSNWPDHLFASEEEEPEEYKDVPCEETCEQLMNLLRLGLISTGIYAGGAPYFPRIAMTILGVNFIKACEDV